MQHLERDLAVHLRLRRAIDGAEAALADLVLDEIAVVEQLAAQIAVDGRRRQLTTRRRRRGLGRRRLRLGATGGVAVGGAIAFISTEPGAIVAAKLIADETGPRLSGTASVAGAHGAAGAGFGGTTGTPPP